MLLIVGMSYNCSAPLVIISHSPLKQCVSVTEADCCATPITRNVPKQELLNESCSHIIFPTQKCYKLSPAAFNHCRCWVYCVTISDLKAFVTLKPTRVAEETYTDKMHLVDISSLAQLKLLYSTCTVMKYTGKYFIIDAKKYWNNLVSPPSPIMAHYWMYLLC